MVGKESASSQKKVAGVEDRDQFQPAGADAVRNDVSGRGYDLTGSDPSTGSAKVGMALKKIDRVGNAPGYQRCVLPGVLRDVPPQPGELADCPARPAYGHRGALVSQGVPHEANHFATFSWLTARPDSSSAMPASSSLSCHSSEST